MQSQKIVTSLILLLIVSFSFTIAGAAQLDLVPGDADANGLANISDAVYLIAFIFGGGPEPPNFCAADVTDDCILNVSDAVDMIASIFDPMHDPLTLGCPHQEFSSGCIDSGVSAAKGNFGLSSVTSDCLSDPGNDSAEYMYAEFIGNDLHVHHINAFYNCCLEYATSYTWTDYFHLVVTEADTGAPCDCLCYFNLEAVIENIEVFELTNIVVTLIGIGGYTVGVDTVSVGGNGYMYAEAEGNDLHLYHMNAFYNCCLGYLVNYEIEGFEITATEADTGLPCYCMCYFNLESVFYDLEDGDYLVRLIGIQGDTVGVTNVAIPGDTALIGRATPVGVIEWSQRHLYEQRE